MKVLLDATAIILIALILSDSREIMLMSSFIDSMQLLLLFKLN